MTAAYQTFMKQYSATGSEKADGYSRDAFIGLAPEEKEAVFRLLVNELPWSVEWLCFVDAERALPIAKAAEQEGRNSPYGDNYWLQTAIVKHTGNLSYQKRMIEDYPVYHDSKKPLVVDAINRTPANETTMAFFKQCILTETNESAAARASRHFMDSLGIARHTQQDREQFDRLLGALCGNDRAAKLRAIAEAEAGAGLSRH